MTINKTEKFKLRKSKKYKNLVSVGLGVMTAVAIGVASDNGAYASDQTVGNATNSATTQPPENKVQSDNLANTNTSTGAVNINIDNSNVKNAVNTAKSEGINVVERTQDLGVTTSTEETTRKRNEAIEQNKAEENKINEVVNNYKKEKEANQNAINTATSENKEKQAQYERALANYEREKSEKESQNVAIRKENEGINTRNNDKKVEYEENLKRAEKAQKQNEQDLENEKELIVQKGGERENNSNGIKVKEGNRIEVEAKGSLNVVSTEFYEVRNNWTLDIKLPNSNIGGGNIVDLMFERLNAFPIANETLRIDGEDVGVIKLIENIKKENNPRSTSDSIEGYNLMHTAKYRLIFNDNISKYKNRHISLSGNNLPAYNNFYGVDKNVIQNIYVNDKLIVSGNAVIKKDPLYPVVSNITSDYQYTSIVVKNDGSIIPNNIKNVIYNSTSNLVNRGTKFEVGDIITFKLDENSPIKFNPEMIVKNFNDLFWTPVRNEGNNMNMVGTLVNHDIVPTFRLLKNTDTELSLVVTEIPRDSAFSLNIELGGKTAKITSYKKEDYSPTKKYAYEVKVSDNRGNDKYKYTTVSNITISGADINSVGELKPYEEKEKFKIKVNYVDTSGKVIKAPYGENNLAYGDKYTVNVPSISNYAFIREKDDKVLNGVFREDLEYTLVYKELRKNMIIIPPNYETPKPELPLPKEPEQPTPKPIPTEVTAPTVGYTSFRLAERPRVFKEARNLDNISLDNSLVSKNSTVKFTLKVDKLPAGREVLNVLEFTDHLPQGYVIDEATVTRENNALGYNTAYDKANHTVVFSANSTLLNKLNENLNEVIDVVAPTVTGTVTNDGGIYKNNFKINLNNKYTTHSNVVTVNTPNGITPNKINTNADNSNIDGKIVVAETTNYYKLLWDLDQYRGMKLSRNDIAKGFYYLEDYPEEAVTINNRLVSLVDSNGTSVQGVEITNYDSLENAPENVKTMLSKANITPKGAFQLFTATNPTDFYNKYVVTGNSIKITNPMVVKDSLTQTGGVYENKAYQIDLGNGYATETVRNIVPKIDTNKHNYNEDGVLVDGKQVVAGTTNYYKLLWDLDQYRGMSATNSEIAKGFFFVEDYPEEGLTIDNSKVTMLDGKGQAVTGVEVSSYNSLENAPEDIKKALVNAKITPKGAFQLFRATNAKDFFNKYVLTGNSITITTPMKVKEELTTTGGTYNNKAYQVDFGKTFETNIVTNIVPKVTPEKHNTNEDGVVVDGKQVVAGTTNHYKLTWDLDQYRDMTATSREVARGFFVVEDYPEEALTIDNSKVTMVDSNGQAVTGVEVLSYDSVENAPEDIKKSLINAKITPKGAFQLFRATNARDFFNKYVLTGNSITITTPMTVKEELTTTGGVFNNKMYQVDFGKGREVEHEVTNNIPKVEPTKHNTNEDGVVIDGKVIAPETVNNYKLLWDLDQYKGVVATSRELAKGFYFVEDYPEEALAINNSKVTMIDSKGQAVTGVEVLSYDSVENAPDDIKKALVNAKITPKGAFQVYKATNSREFYDKYVFTGNSITITSPMTMLDSVNKNGAVYNNKAYQIDFGKGRETDVVTNTVPKSNPEKHNFNEDGVLIDGGLVPVGSTTEYKLTWKLSNLRDVVGTNEAINRGFYYIDDYPEVLKTLDDRIKVLDSNGNVVNGIRVTKYDNLEQASSEIKAILSKNNITPKGAFQVFSAENPIEFYNNYVKKGIDLTIVNPMQVTQALKENGGSYQNVAYEIDFGVAQVTDTITNTVPKVKPVKHNYNEDNVKIDGKVVLAASRTNYKLNWNLSAYKNVEASDKYIKKGFYFVDDYPEEALNLDEKNITITDDKGKAVVGVEVVNYESLEKAPEEVKAVLKEAKVTPKGAFQLFRATDSKQFYNDYVKTGTNLTITNPMTVKPELARKDSKKVVDNISKETENKTVKDVTKVNNSVTTTNTKPEVDKAINEAVERENNTLNTISKVSTGNTEKEKGKNTKGTEKTTEYKNRGYQIDFGNGYETDVVANNVPKIDPIKDVVIDVKGKESLQGKEIKLNKLFNYKLIGTEIPSNRGTKLTQYGFSDDYDEKADKYQANYRVFAMKDIKLTDGSIIKQDSELTKYTTQIMTDGKVDIEFDKEFLDKVDLDSEFQAEVYLQMERIASGEVKNTFIHTVNGVEETSNTVITFTKEPEKPVEPEKPEEPKQSVPPKVEEKTPNKSTGKVLPNTGIADNDGTSTAIALTALATAGFIARRKKVKNS